MSKAEWSLLSSLLSPRMRPLHGNHIATSADSFTFDFIVWMAYNVFILSPADWQPCCFWCGPATNKTAVGIHECLFVQIHVEFPQQMGFLGHGECVFYCKSHQLFTKRPHHCAASTIRAFPLLLIRTALFSVLVGFFLLLILTVLRGTGCAVAGMRVAPHRFICLNNWSTVSVTVWKGLRGVAFLESVGH